MKKISKTKALTAALSAACIGITAVCWAVSRDKSTVFLPDAPIPSTQPQEWQAGPPPAIVNDDSANIHTTASVPAPASAAQDKENSLEGYPKVAEESPEQVTIDFTPDAEELQPEPPEPPTPEGSTNDPSAPPAYTPESLSPTPAPTAPPVQNNAPAPGAVNDDGAVYDPVFGWVYPSKVSQTTMDSAGDPDKMVGNMGR